jgi:tetratricopeptide (TPR) repeat protein
MMAQMELERNNPDAAHEYLQKGAKYYNNNTASRNRTYLHLADLSFKQKKYAAAASYYDSLQVADLQPAEAERIKVRKDFLGRLVSNLNTVHRQDSLQRIANLPEEERTDFLKKLARQLRRQQGLKDDETVSSTMASTVASQSDPFRTESKGEWYFYNKASRERGAATFRQIWGNRPNADNWRRGSSVMAELRATLPENTRGIPAVGFVDTSGVITSETLLKSLPTTPEQLKISNDSIQYALLTAGNIYFNEIEDYPSAIQAYEELRKRFPGYFDMSEVLFHLYYAYQKTGETAKAEEIKKLLQQNFPSSRHTSILASGVDPLSSRPSTEVTKTYEGIYDMFIEGRFEEAKVAKHIADSIYKTNYWSPQLLYIESVYYIRQNDDSTAKKILNTLIQQDPQSAMAAKATTLLDVLSRRKQIEEELRNLQIERPQEEVDTVQQQMAVINQPSEPVRQTQLPKDTIAVTKADVVKKELGQKQPETKKEVVVIKPDPVKEDTVVAKIPETIKEDTVVAKVPEPVLKDTITTKVPEPIKEDTLIAKVPEQPKELIKTEEPIKRDTAAAKREEIVISKPPQQIITDTAAKKPMVTKPSAYGFTYDAEAPHYAVVILNKVDNIFSSEARNAFTRFSKESYVNQAPNVQLVSLDAENKLLLIGSFSNILHATDFVQRAKPIASTQIVPWLKAEKYTFSVISESNLQILKANPNLVDYKKFLEQFSKLSW